MCAFARQLMLFVAQINTRLLSVISDAHRAAENSRGPKHPLPGEVQQGDALPSFLSSHTVNEHLFRGLFSGTFFTFLCFLWVVLLFKMALKQSADVLVRVPRCQRTVMCLTEKTRVPGKSLSLVSYNVVGLEFNVNESIMHIK